VPYKSQLFQLELDHQNAQRMMDFSISWSAGKNEGRNSGSNLISAEVNFLQ